MDLTVSYYIVDTKILFFMMVNITNFASIVLEQDAEAAEMNQRGLRSPRFEAGRLMPQEFYIHHFHEWVRQRLDIN